jgi:hypothetical protein
MRFRAESTRDRGEGGWGLAGNGRHDRGAAPDSGGIRCRERRGGAQNFLDIFVRRPDIIVVVEGGVGDLMRYAGP